MKTEGIKALNITADKNKNDTRDDARRKLLREKLDRDFEKRN